ncbi:hypothetical protein WJX84_009331 [Apatococcus fuscideae]|uniref:AB hydrolase-1 domain-containing protein n=1 Tax=Apatococcus fuscideae TaxID=2026836 RepID=A0AAW1SK21_9CHLO
MEADSQVRQQDLILAPSGHPSRAASPPPKIPPSSPSTVGSMEDQQALSLRYRCLAVDLPGHGRTLVTSSSHTSNVEQLLEGCCVVGYSLGARLALLLAHRHPLLFSGAVIISGSPGVRDDPAIAPKVQRAEAGARQGTLVSRPACTGSERHVLWAPATAVG